MFVITVRDSAMGTLSAQAYASDAAGVSYAERVLTAVDSALARLSRAEGKRAARKDPARKAKREKN
jgi:hypothetical protein